jgi:hypothetical protein
MALPMLIHAYLAGSVLTSALISSTASARTLTVIMSIVYVYLNITYLI